MNLIEATKSNFKIFCQFVYQDFEVANHHERIIDELQEIFEGKKDRLMINVPPQRGKSLITSVLFPAFLLANNQNTRIVVISYGQELSLKFTRDAKSVIEGERFQLLCPGTKFKKDLQRADYFSIENSKGYYKSTSIGGSLTGFSADCIIIDDSVKDWQQASSAGYREEVWNYFTTVALTRLSPNGKVIICQTRWNEQDLCGKLLEKHSRDWNVLKIKAIEDDSTVCWSSRYTLQDYEKIRQSVGIAQFNALYQQEPRGTGETTFDINNFRYYDERECPHIQWVRSWDLAIATNQRSDYSACSLIGISSDGDIYIKNVQRYKLPWNQLMDKIEQVAYADGSLVHVMIEAVSIGIAGYDEVKRRLQGHIVRKAENTHLKKEQKAMVFASRNELQKVRLLKNQNWHSMFLDECLSFPGGHHDDMVDCVSNAVNYLASRAGTFQEAEVYQPGTIGYYDALIATQTVQKPRRGIKKFI